jgi:D-alanine--poly(phosphoribitol) ligase subunit 1
MLRKIQKSWMNFGDRNAFHIKDTDYTYNQFAQTLSNIRYYLENNCSGDEKLIGVVSKDTADFFTYASLYGALFAGYGFVPINPDNPLSRNLSVLGQTGIKTILSSIDNEKVTELVKAANVKLQYTPSLEDAVINLTPPDVDESEIAYILFTSGSTGVPKGVPITRGNLSAFVEAFESLNYRLDENDRFMQMFELTFDFSVVCYTVPLCYGMCIYPVPIGNIKYASVYTILEEKEITFACMVPSIINYLRPYFPEITLPKLKYSLFCGEALYADITAEWLNSTPNSTIINAYGPTEATVFCLIYEWNYQREINKTLNGTVSIGKEMVDMYAIIVDEKLQELPAGEKGELCLAGAQLTPGYWRNEERNKEMFFEYNSSGELRRFYRTGDLALKDEEGDFMFVGRIDSQIKIQGFRIELGEIEHFAREFVQPANVAAISYPNSAGNNQIHLFLENYLGSNDDLVLFLKNKVPHYMVPSFITNIPTFPLNSNGKVDKKELNNLASENNEPVKL